MTRLLALALALTFAIVPFSASAKGGAGGAGGSAGGGTGSAGGGTGGTGGGTGSAGGGHSAKSGTHSGKSAKGPGQESESGDSKGSGQTKLVNASAKPDKDTAATAKDPKKKKK